MGFWQTGYMEFHEQSGYGASYVPPEPSPPEFRCEQCDEVFPSILDLTSHRFVDHKSQRARLFLLGKECDRSRTLIVSPTKPEDWAFDGAETIRINGTEVDESSARVLLSSSAGSVAVELGGGQLNQGFHFDFEVATDGDLDAVDGALKKLIAGRSLSQSSIQGFLDQCRPFKTSASYSNGIANYFYGVLAREHSPESSIWQDGLSGVTYRDRFDDAASQLGLLSRPAAAAICGLVAFHYNHFEVVRNKSRSRWVSSVATRMLSLLAGEFSTWEKGALSSKNDSSIDLALCDSESEQILKWCSVPLDGSAKYSAEALDSEILRVDPLDELKLRVMAGELYLACGEVEGARRHRDALRNNSTAEAWCKSVGRRITLEN